MTAPTLLPVQFDTPHVEAEPGGLYAVTTWTDGAGPTRWLASGVQVRPRNYGGESAFGVWGAPWCASPDDLTPDDVKGGERPDDGLDPFEPMTVWAFDESDDCGPADPSATEVRARARQVLAMQETVAVEREFAARMLADVGTPATAASLAEALGYLDEAFAATSTRGVIHARPALLPIAARDNLLVVTRGQLRTPGGHLWAFGGGYPTPLGDTLIATSPTFGWRDTVQVRHVHQHEVNRYIAIAERSVVVGYETAVAAVTII